MIRSSPFYPGGVGAVALVGVALLGCDKGDKGTPPTTASASAALSATPPDSGAPDAGPKKGFTLITTWGKDIGLQTPESVIHDEISDVYFVSNIVGKPLEADGKAFISKLAPEAIGLELKFIESGKKGVTLNAPKGMALVGDVLWVADIDTVRSFDRKTGAPKDNIKIPGATSLNDIAASDDSIVITENDAVYKIDKDKKLTTLSKSKDLGKPNGVFVVGDKTWMVTWGGNQLFTLDEKGNPAQIGKLPSGQLDGLQMFSTDFFVSSWEGKAIYRGQPGGTFTAVIENVPSPADFLFDKKRNRIIVPIFNDDEIRAYQMQ